MQKVPFFLRKELSANTCQRRWIHCMERKPEEAVDVANQIPSPATVSSLWDIRLVTVYFLYTDGSVYQLLRDSLTVPMVEVWRKTTPPHSQEKFYGLRLPGGGWGEGKNERKMVLSCQRGSMLGSGWTFPEICILSKIMVKLPLPSTRIRTVKREKRRMTLWKSYNHIYR